MQYAQKIKNLTVLYKKGAMDNLLEITLKNNKKIIPEISSFISESANKLGLDKKKSTFLCFTLETLLELRTSAISEENPQIKLSVIDNGSYFKISVTDLGEPYILTKNQQAILKKGLVDKYSFEQLGRKGQCFSFTFNYTPKINTEELEPKKEETLLDENFSFDILPSADEEILEAIKCIYASYGYQYFHQHLYSVESFKKYVKGNTYVPIICKNEHKQVMCYCALDENQWFKGIPEFSNLVTKPLARGKKLATRIFTKTEEVAKNLSYEGIHVSAVAYHPYTQKLCNKFNYTPCAIEYAINPPDTIGPTTPGRSSCVLCVKIFNKQKKHTIFVSEECKNMVDSIFKSEELNYEINTTGINLLTDSSIDYIIDSDTDNCFIKVDRCGEEFEKEFSKIIKSEEVLSMDVTTVNLCMNHPSAISGYNILKKLGFICTGILPGSKNGDFLIMQSFKEIPDFNNIVLEDNYKKLAKEVKGINNL